MSTEVLPQSKTVLANGIRLHYLEWGTPDKPWMLLLHGLRGHARSWDDFSGPMASHYRAISLDQRGRGDSDWAKDGDYTTEAYAQDLASFCESLGMSSITLVGHSMGARNAMAYTARFPDKVAKLVIVDAPPGNMPDRDRIRQEMITVPEEFDSFEAVYSHVRKINPLPPEEVLRRRVQYQTRELPSGKVGWKYDIAIREGFRKSTVVPASQGQWEAWRKITCPTLIVRGVETDALPNEMAKEMTDSHPNAQVVEVSRSAHMVFEDNPGGFLEAVSRWLGV